jgi:hypothetical protein
MNRLTIALLIFTVTVTGCTRSLEIDSWQVSEIQVGRVSLTNATVISRLTDPNDIADFIYNVRFRRERDYTVKHPLRAYFTLHSATGLICRATFEDDMMRLDQREYTLTDGGAVVLEQYLTRVFPIIGYSPQED